MIYAPHFQLRAFDSLSEDAKLATLGHLLEALIGVNAAWLKENPGTPRLYESGVRYQEEPAGRDDWQDIPETLARRFGDCEDLACWRIAELRVREHERARPYLKKTTVGPRTIYHVAVYRDDRDALEDPSRFLGMR